jgi:hypothetical protein
LLHSSDATVPHGRRNLAPSFVTSALLLLVSPAESSLCLCASVALNSVAPCLHTLMNCSSRKPFVLTTIRTAPGVWGANSRTASVFLMRRVSQWQIHSFHTIAASLSARKKSSALESITSGLFCKNAGVGWAFRMLLRETRGGGIHTRQKGVPTHAPQWSSQSTPPIHESSTYSVFRRGLDPSVTPSRTTTYTRQPYASLCAARRSTCRASS